MSIKQSLLLIPALMLPPSVALVLLFMGVSMNQLYEQSWIKNVA